jgi:cytochrome b561
MFAMPLSGWLMSSASGYLPSIFGLFNLPGLISPNQESSKLFEEAHQWIGYGLIALICIHLLAALKHHFIDKDDVLKRIIS